MRLSEQLLTGYQWVIKCSSAHHERPCLFASAPLSESHPQVKFETVFADTMPMTPKTLHSSAFVKLGRRARKFRENIRGVLQTASCMYTRAPKHQVMTL